MSMDSPKTKTFCATRKMLAEAKEKLTPNRWIKGSYFGAMQRHCAIGALIKAAEHDDMVRHIKINPQDSRDESLKLAYRTLRDVVDLAPEHFNDSFSTTLGDVHAMFDLAIEKVEKEIEELGNKEGG